MNDAYNRVFVRNAGLVLVAAMSSLILTGSPADPELKQTADPAPALTADPFPNSGPGSGEDNVRLSIRNSLDPAEGAPDLVIVSVQLENRDSGEIQAVDLQDIPILTGESAETCCVDAGSYDVSVRLDDGTEHGFAILKVTETDACEVIVQLKWTDATGTHAIAKGCAGSLP